jgi:hypothetical protein
VDDADDREDARDALAAGCDVGLLVAAASLLCVALTEAAYEGGASCSGPASSLVMGTAWRCPVW